MGFDVEFLRALERLSHLARRLGRACVPRRRPPPRRQAASGEFRDRRPYTAGDECRYVDWPAYGRFGRLLVKLFEADEARDVWILVDASASMGSGPNYRKLTWARRTAAAVAVLASAHHDRVGAASFADGLVAELVPRAGRGAVSRVLALLADLEARGPSEPAKAASELLSRRRRVRRALAVLITDGLWPCDPSRPLSLLGAAGLDLVVLHGIEPEDRSPPIEGALEIVDAETGRSRMASVDEALLEAYRRAFDAHQAAMAVACTRTGAAYVAARTDAPVEAALLDILRAGGLG